MIKPNNIIEYGKIENMDNLLKALNDNLITNKGMGLPNCKDITYNVDLTKSKYIKKGRC